MVTIHACLKLALGRLIQVEPFNITGSSHLISVSLIVLSSFSPVGSGGTKVRPAEDSIVAQIQPRNSTPLQSSSISRSMVSADVGDSGLGLSVKEGIPQSFMGSSVKSPTDAGLANESLSRLSISGRLSLGQPPATPVARNRQSITNLLSAPTPTVSVEEGKKGLDAPPTTGRSELIRDRFASVDRTTTVIAPVEPKDSLISVDTAMGKPGPALSNQPLEAPRNGHISVNPSLSSSSMTSSATNGLTTSNSGNIPQLIKGLVERSITDAMAEIRNDIQNLHVELIKQSLAQQNALHQIVANMPDMYKKLSDEYRVLQEENERLKLRLSLEK